MSAPLIRQAAKDGAKLILTPEGVNLLEQRREGRERAVTDQDADAAVTGLRDLARELGVWLLIGSAIVWSGREGDGRAANRSLLIDDGGEIVATYDKLHVFDVDLPDGESWKESAVIRPGDGAVAASHALGRAGHDGLLRRALPAPVSPAGQGGRGDDRGSGRLHPSHRRGALGDPAAGPGHRDRLLHPGPGPGRRARGRPQDLGPLHDRRAVGRGDGSRWRATSLAC